MAEMLEVVMRDNGFSCGGIKQAVRGRSQPGQWVSSTLLLLLLLPLLLLLDPFKPHQS